MKNVARPKKDTTKPRWRRGMPWPLRVATAEEIADEARRYREAQPRIFGSVEDFGKGSREPLVPDGEARIKGSRDPLTIGEDQP